MGLKLADRSLEPGYRYFERFVPPSEPAEKIRGPEPAINPQAQVHDSILGPWCRVGARTSLSETAMGAFSYIVNDSSSAYAEIGKFCSIARDVRINPGNHPTWKAPSITSAIGRFPMSWATRTTRTSSNGGGPIP
ncbi:MAG: hypothetical protein U1E24_05560 [Phenylobacterium sp.]|nr:hypothetical protein [Phenylobacterium sp.]